MLRWFWIRIILFQQFLLILNKDMKYIFSVLFGKMLNMSFYSLFFFIVNTDEGCSIRLKYLLKWSKSWAFGISKSSWDLSRTMKRSYTEICSVVFYNLKRTSLMSCSMKHVMKNIYILGHCSILIILHNYLIWDR